MLKTYSARNKDHSLLAVCMREIYVSVVANLLTGGYYKNSLLCCCTTHPSSVIGSSNILNYDDYTTCYVTSTDNVEPY